MKHRFTNSYSSITVSFVFIRLHRSLICLALGPFTIAVSPAQEPLAKGIQDNSFFVEEAYNQEVGVVQHIFNLPIFSMHGDKELSPNFTQEWPFFGQTHQLSYTVPYTFTDDTNAFNDVRLNYRLQALMESEHAPAFAPRFTLVLPTGNPDKEIGHDRLGYEINLPFSKIVSDRWTLHFNAGGNVFPDVHDHDLWNYNLAGSAIFALSRNFNLMLESVVSWQEDIHKARRIERTVAALISPGARYAINLPNDLQIVVGGAVPVGLTSDSPDWGLFFYLSFEHPFVRATSGQKK
jgi:hypothetical protein